LGIWGGLKNPLEGLRIEAYFPDVSASISPNPQFQLFLKKYLLSEEKHGFFTL
jgi:hypothetical protein